MVSVSAVLIFILVLGLLVLIHECGHAIAARIAGVTVEEFGIGFPPRLLSWKKNNTLYTLNVIPLGGFVRLKGIAEHSTERLNDDQVGNFQYKPIGVRLLIVAAGILMNALIAVVLFAIAYTIGFQQVKPLTPTNARISNPQVEVVSLLPEGAATRAGIQPGDRVIQLNEQTIATTEEFQSVMGQSLGTTVQVHILRNDEQVTLPVAAERIDYNGQQLIGIGVGLQDTVHLRYTWYRAPIVALQTTAYLTGAIFKALADALQQLFIDRNVPEGLTGPVGIAVITGQVTKSGIVALLQFSAILSINLALFNILPIPALDGGRLFFLLIEMITRRKVNQRVETIVHQLGFVLLIGLMILVTYNDILRL